MQHVIKEGHIAVNNQNISEFILNILYQRKDGDRGSDGHAEVH